MEKKTILKIENLNKFFESRNNYKIALDNISFEVLEGDFLGIIGESGSGKTTLGRTIIRLSDATSGKIKLFNENISNKKINKQENLAICRSMQMIFQDPLSSLNPKMNILKIISEPVIINKSLKKENAKIIESRHKANFLFEYEMLSELSENKYENIYKYFVQYKKIIDETISKLEVLKFTNNNSWTESFIDLEAILDFYIMSQKPVIKILNNMYQNAKKIISSYDNKIKSNNLEPIYLKYIEYSNNLDEAKADFGNKENSINNLKNKLKKINNDIAFFKSNRLVKSEIKDLKIHIKLNHNGMKISKTKRDYNFKKLSLIRDELKLQILKDFLNFENVDEENLINEYRKIRTIIDEFFKDKFTSIFNDNLSENYEKKMNSINYELIKKEIENSLSKSLIDFKNKLQIIDQKNEIIINDLLSEKTIIAEEISKLKSKKREQEKTFYTSESYIQKNNDFKKVKDEINLLRKDKHKKHNEFVKKNLSEIKSKIKTESKEVKIRKDLLTKKIKLIIKDILAIRPTELENFSKKDASQMIKKNTKAMREQFKNKMASFKLIDFEFKKILEYYFIEERICSSNKAKLFFYRNDFLKIMILEKVFDLLESVGLKKEHAYRYPHEFSGGQRQRIVIARALINDPKIIIADEAISALDVSIQAQVVNMMKDLCEKRKVTFLFIAHDISMVNYICNKVIIMHDGKIVEKGNTNKIFKNPVHPYTQSLLKAVPELWKMDVDLSLFEDSSNYADSYSISNKPHFIKVENDHEVLATQEQFNKWA
ncbi:MAG: ATP-binding cassette domain-containing protein [Mycoplasmoidaceae bacterium]